MLYNKVGRICVRSSKTCGLFIPLTTSLEPGVYEVRKILDELTIVEIGQPSMPSARYEGLSLNELIDELPYLAMTTEEIEMAHQYKEEQKNAHGERKRNRQ